MNDERSSFAPIRICVGSDIDSQTLTSCLLLRFAAYRELGYIDTNDTGLELDTYDLHSQHFAALNNEGQVVGTVRLIISEQSFQSPHYEHLRRMMQVQPSEISPSKVASRKRLPLRNVVGFDQSLLSEQDACELSRLVVDQRFRHRGIGTALLNEALSFAAKANCTVVVQCLSTDALIYRERGFAQIASGIKHCSLKVSAEIVALVFPGNGEAPHSTNQRLRANYPDCQADSGAAEE